jgi:hypothetical protein
VQARIIYLLYNCYCVWLICSSKAFKERQLMADNGQYKYQHIHTHSITAYTISRLRLSQAVLPLVEHCTMHSKTVITTLKCRSCKRTQFFVCFCSQLRTCHFLMLCRSAKLGCVLTLSQDRNCCKQYCGLHNIILCV